MAPLPLADALPVLLDALRERAAADPAVRAALHAAGSALVRAAEAGAPEAGMPEAGSGDARPTGPPAKGPPPDPAAAEQLAALARHFREQAFVPAPAGPAPQPPAPARVDDAVLGRVARSLILSASVARALGAAGEAGLTARQVDTFRSYAGEIPADEPWLLAPGAPGASPEAYQAYAACAEATARAAQMLGGLRADAADIHDRDCFSEAIHLAAEAQSALRVAFLAVHGRPPSASGPDEPNQVPFFYWLRSVTDEARVFVERHMRRDDPADPARIPLVTERLARLAGGAGLALGPTRTPSLSGVRYHVQRLLDGRADPAYETERLYARLGETVQAGLPPSDTGLRELLLPALDALDQDVPVPFPVERVFRALDRACAQAEAQAEAASPACPEAPGPHVREAAALLRGRTAVLFGGERRPHAERALREALGLAGLEWVETREHQSTAPFEPVVARPEVSVVLLAIRWASHSFGDLRAYCARHGKLLVRLPGGYNPNQVAYQVLQQAGEALRAPGSAAA